MLSLQIFPLCRYWISVTRETSLVLSSFAQLELVIFKKKFSFTQHHALGRPRMQTQRLLIVSNGEPYRSRRTGKLLKCNDEQHIINGFWDARLGSVYGRMLCLKTILSCIYFHKWLMEKLCYAGYPIQIVDSKGFWLWCSYISRSYWDLVFVQLQNTAFRKLDIVTYPGLAWLIIMGSGLDE
jgi:hypothetical protein